MSGACIPPLWLAAVNFRAMSGSAAVSQNRPQGDVASSSPANPSLLITMLAAIAEFERELSTDERAAQAGMGGRRQYGQDHLSPPIHSQDPPIQ
jgi:DNA invertase Pin-like site-specific DNA recombinase